MPDKSTRTHLRPLLALALAAAALSWGVAAPALAAGSCSAPSFTQSPLYSVGNDTRAEALADFDGDGPPTS